MKRVKNGIKPRAGQGPAHEILVTAQIGGTAAFSGKCTVKRTKDYGKYKYET
jgi:hypothetical protein